MASYPQIYVSTKYQEFIKSLASVGKPQAVELNFIKRLGFKSSYDEKFLPAIKFIGLVETKRGGGPTELWSQLRTDMGAALARGLIKGYGDLFSFYPDAHLRDEEALANFFRGNSTGDADSVSRMVNAFVAIRELASFDTAFDGEGDVTAGTESIDKVNSTVQETIALPSAANAARGMVNVNIQLQLPSDATGEVYDRFFEAMKKHGIV